MISYIRGTLAFFEEDKVVVEVESSESSELDAVTN